MTRKFYTPIDMTTDNKIVNLAAPTDPDDAATKDYVDTTTYHDPTVANGDMVVRLGAVDVAPSGSVSASSTYETYLADYVHDEDENTQHIHINTNNEWLKIDFGIDTEISGWRIKQNPLSGGGATNSYVIESSIDDANWTVRAARSGNAIADSGIVALSSAITARYWRALAGATGATGYGWGIYTFGLFSSSIDRLPIGAEGKALRVVSGIPAWATGAPTAANYLVGTAQADLSAEIVVGTTPGGELGGTWASPTVDTTHSGSAHHAHVLNNLAATTDPAVTDDSGAGYAISSRWINVSTDEEFVATDVTVGAAVWVSTTAGGGGGITVEDEGTPLATAADTLDFVGAGVVASGAGAIKTITISGASVADILDLPTAETVATKVLAPDGFGGVEFRAETGGGAPTAAEVTFTPAGTIAATDAQAAVEEVATDAASALSGHTGDATDAHDASAISVLDAAAHFTGTDVETVLGELADSITGGGIPATLIDAKGDLIVGSAADTAARLAIGATTGHVLTVDPAETTGMKWAAAAGGGGGITVSDEGTPLATDATTIDFVGAGVVATGAGATKTITIAGGGGGGTPAANSAALIAASNLFR